jgi:hypothetical protein
MGKLQPCSKIFLKIANDTSVHCKLGHFVTSEKSFFRELFICLLFNLFSLIVKFQLRKFDLRFRPPFVERIGWEKGN